MRLKSELYKKEQEEVIDKIITILDLEHNNPFILYHLDNNKELQQQNQDQSHLFKQFMYQQMILQIQHQPLHSLTWMPTLCFQELSLN